MVLESQSRDTIDEVRALGALLGKERFVVVTSATHLPRAMAMFKHAGMNPIPAPTDYLALHAAPQIEDWVPHAGAGFMIERALHEYVGLFWAKLRGQAR
jgi:uncharacterized SAM-binding protein YcdF (DUF218 family)